MEDKTYQTSWKNFSEDELKCQHTGETNPNPQFKALMDKVQTLRDLYGKPIQISSAYRSPDHPIERSKANGGGFHTIAAVDLQVSGEAAVEILTIALKLGFTGIGISQKGDWDKRFIHLDLRSTPTIWSY